MSQVENNKAVVSRKDREAVDQKTGKNYLLVIGIDTYVHCPPLNNAVKDAKDFIAILTKKYAFDEKYLTFIKDTEANKDRIIDAFRTLKKQIRPLDNLVIYYSGHGEIDEDFGESYLVTVDSRKGKIGDYLSHEQMIRFIEAIKTKHTLLILDACFAGTFLVERRSINSLEKDPSRYVIASGRKEYVSDGIIGENSPFAAALLEKLRNNIDSLLVSDLAQYVMKQTIKATKETQRPIHSHLLLKEDKGGQFVFHLKMDEVADWKNTLTANTVIAFQSFVAKYPDGKNTPIAQEKIKSIQAANLWQKVEMARDNSLKEVSHKLRLLNQYVDKYENQAHYEEALNLGELLDYKRQFLQAQSSEFALRRFLRKRMPSVEGADAIKKLAQAKLTNWANPPIEKEEPAKIIPPVKNRPEAKPPPAPPFDKPVFYETTTSNNYRNYLLLLLIPLIGYGIYEIVNNRGEGKQVNPTEVIKDDKPIVDTQAIALASAQQAYNEDLAKGDTELRSSRVNYQTAKAHYQEAMNAVKGFDIDTKAAETGIKKCNGEIAKQSAAEREKQRKAKEAKIQKDYDQLISDGKRDYDKGDYKNALIKYQAAKGKVDNDDTAQRGIINSRRKLDDLEKKKQAQLATKQYVHDKLWKDAKTKNTIPAYEAYLKKYPKGTHHNQATYRIKKMNEAGIFKDARDGQIYKWVRLKDGKKWMAENLNYKTADSWCYTNISSNCTKYGRLYNWDAAKKVCPSGWRLPTDDEWRNMTKYYGGCNDDASDRGKKANTALIQGGNSGFSAVFGGYRRFDGYFSDFNNDGYYWSSTEQGDAHAWFYSFDKYYYLQRNGSYGKNWARSCRCLQD